VSDFVLDFVLDFVNSVEDRNALFKVFLSSVKYYLNKHKGHVRRKIRAAANSKYCKNSYYFFVVIL
jgi:hypothetical protein